MDLKVGKIEFSQHPYLRGDVKSKEQILSLISIIETLVKKSNDMSVEMTALKQEFKDLKRRFDEISLS